MPELPSGTAGEPVAVVSDGDVLFFLTVHCADDAHPLGWSIVRYRSNEDVAPIAAGDLTSLPSQFRAWDLPGVVALAIARPGADGVDWAMSVGPPGASQPVMPSCNPGQVLSTVFAPVRSENSIVWPVGCGSTTIRNGGLLVLQTYDGGPAPVASFEFDQSDARVTFPAETASRFGYLLLQAQGPDASTFETMLIDLSTHTIVRRITGTSGRVAFTREELGI